MRSRGLRSSPPSSFILEDDEDSKNIRCGSISLAAALALIISGLCLMNISNYQSARSTLEDEYNEGVDKWNEREFNLFNRTSWDLVVDGTIIPLVPLIESENMGKGEPNEELKPYPPLRFTLPEIIPAYEIESKELDIEEGEDPTQVDRAVVNATSAGLLRERKVWLVVHERNSEQSQKVMLPSVALLKQQTRKASGWKVCKYQNGGYFSGRAHTCTTYSAPISLCVKVEKSVSSGQWSISPRYGGEGCGPRNNWEPYSWRRVHAPATGNLPKASEDMLVVFPKTTIRFVEDPFLLAQNLTDGSLVFAESAAEELATGMVLVIVGCVSLLPACLLVGPIIKYFRNRRRKENYFVRQVDAE
eukprot:CAMPEP_0196578710 /NCGR_PEP_ID=MMETSP1081-20130531/7556_1 /TAXON_ID=36882 /ORGANISM="Pyramimonas amylifera, Strain CCMP720" /LENGTH=359 /DNA_ID=CAMNT_0041898011 /DNA_START=267 /DNA_END=1346 /DNA_ORIENTATION=+